MALLASGSTAAETLFPQPRELDPDVNFWISIFTEYETDEGVLHDNRYLGVIYERMDMPTDVSRRERNRRVQKRREYYQAILRTLASGRRDGLSADEQRVLELWGSSVSNGELQAATSRIRYQQGLSNRFREGLVRAGRWRDYVDAAFLRHGVPADLAALPHVESSYNPDARSHVGASGIWQFTRGTGRRFMQVDHVLDERNDPYLATEAAARLLAYNYSIVGNWPMAITAYNHGLAGVRRAMQQFGDDQYAKILREYRGRTFGFASRNFYVAFLAARHVDQNVEQYFPGLVPDAPIDYQAYTLQGYLPVGALSDAVGISEREIAQHNPALQATIFQGSKYLPKDYTLRVPANRLAKPLDELMAGIGDDLWFDEQLPDLFHTVVRGDTVSEIADAYGTRVSTLAALNNLDSRNRIRVGQLLRLPAAGPAPQAVADTQAEEKAPPVIVAEVMPVTEPEPDAEEVVEVVELVQAALDDETDDRALADDLEVATVETGARATLLSDPSDYTVAEDLTIEVQPLETLGHFADWLGIKTQRLRDLNGLAFRTPVELGQRIQLDFSQVNPSSFESLRMEYHRQQQDAFFRTHSIAGVEEHEVDRGESVWVLSLRRYGVPIWLFRQYNPELDLHNVRPGTRLRFPVLVNRSEAS